MQRMARARVRTTFRRTALGTLLCLVLSAGPPWMGFAHAALGGDAASVLADGAEMHGVANSHYFQQYDEQQITGESGMRVREFLNRDGVVFAVAWTGPVLPDLQRLLGAHFAEYATALTAFNHPGLHRSVRVASPGLVVESGGHLRAYAGRAYLPALIPVGMSPADLR
jgi:hypothetical protein